MKILNANDGTEFLVSSRDHLSVKNMNWHIDSKGYPATTLNSKTVRLHSFLLGKPLPGFETDHINRDKLDNRRENIKIVPAHRNRRNHKIQSTNKSGFNGVYWNKQNKNWVAQITVKHKTIFLGSFDDIRQAQITRLDAEVRYWKVFVVVCSYCLKNLGYRHSTQPGISHGICTTCQEGIMAERNGQDGASRISPPFPAPRPLLNENQPPVGRKEIEGG